MNKMPYYLDNFLELIYPSVCITCGERLSSQEKFICINCWLDLPVGRFHADSENKVAQLFWGRVNIEHATSWFQYRKGSMYQELIHFIKYKGQKELGLEAGNRFGDLLVATGTFASVDIIVPVPLHKRRQVKRGYNQSEWIAMGIGEAFQKPVMAGNLFRQIFNPTQTRKNRFERWQNVDGIFGVKNPLEFENKHLLLVDDVVTTGSTLEACAWELLKIKGVKVSIATLAFADL
jgi:ComF family protein